MRSASSNRRTGGYVALWLLIAIALIALASLGVASLLQPDTVIPAAWVVGCVAVAAVGLAIEARHDSYDFLKIGGMFAAIGAAGCGLVATFGAGSHPLALAGAIVLGLGSATAFTGLYR
ncbi:MAG TPA: hypothetical protein ENO23_07765, partial [Alphaproteobacteria bacterium]|nr:hypothetical protein [Alphaproteobacteria bacterium]